MNDELGLALNSTERFLCSVLTHCDYLDCKTISDLYSIVGDKDHFDIRQKMLDSLFILTYILLLLTYACCLVLLKSLEKALALVLRKCH